MKLSLFALLFFPSFLALTIPSKNSLTFQTEQNLHSVRLARRHLLQNVLPNFQLQHTQFHKRAFSRMAGYVFPNMRSGAQHLDASNLIPAQMLPIYGKMRPDISIPVELVAQKEPFNVAVNQALRQVDNVDDAIPQPGFGTFNSR